MEKESNILIIFLIAIGVALANIRQFNRLALSSKSNTPSWKAQTFSTVGRLTLIKSSVNGIPNHTLSCFKCPKEVSTLVANDFIFGDLPLRFQLWLGRMLAFLKTWGFLV